ncbi:efflux RND transporter periplasmic adaptor subunit [Leptolyngbya sp. KIOST-1]|uniref:efflux RND transporter periplasmic adaptor subunit n=1 Tax=Leptolyngbya sp. KIOST-1 TaxID=1229172 RepID=UPI000907A216|nr:efflux RND transporter periplasmic adaptor subunit [Leptolyngbya sp. KIOST-1]
MRVQPCRASVWASSVLGLVLVSAPIAALAHTGHDHGAEFQSGTSQPASGIRVDSATAERLGIQVVPVKREVLSLGLQTTGELIAQPDKAVMVNAPINGTVVELLVEPGETVTAGQPLARILAPDLIDLRVSAQEDRVGAEADLRSAEANLTLAQRNYERQGAIATTEIQAAQKQLDLAQERFTQDERLLGAGAIARQQFLESQSELAEAQSNLTRAQSQQPLLEAQAELERARATLAAARSQVQLSTAAYETRLQQLNSPATEQGMVTINAPIAGKVAERPVTLGEAVEEAVTPLLSIVNGDSLRVTANVYEKDLGTVAPGQSVRITVASLPDQFFTGQVITVGAVVDGTSRVVPVTAVLEDAGDRLKPGMFAELEILTEQTPTPVLTVPASAVVDADGKSLVFVQNGDAFEPVEVTLGRTAGDAVEVQSGLFEGDQVVTQGALQLYAQSLRGDGSEAEAEADMATTRQGAPLWLLAVGGVGAIAATATTAFLLGRRSRPVPVHALNGSSPDPNSSFAAVPIAQEPVAVEDK